MAGRLSPGSPFGSGDYGNGDEQFALNVVSSICSRIADINMTDNEELCREALSAGGAQVISRDGPKSVKKPKKEEKRNSDIFQKPLTSQQSRNHALRFGYGTAGVANTRSSWSFFRQSTDGAKESDSKRDYEDVVDPEILNAPICDVCIVQSKTLPPPGFYRLHKTPTNKKADLNLSSSGNPLYLCIKKDLSGGSLYPITNFIVVFPDRNEYTPPGYAVVNRGKTACNLNSGTTSERIFLCYRKEASGNPLTDVQLILPGKGEVPPPAFNLIEKSISGIPANLNTGTGGVEVYLCYRQHMNRLNCLLTEPTPQEEETRSRLRSIRRNSLRSFDDADRMDASSHHAPFTGGTGNRPNSGSMQPISINRIKSVTIAAPGLANAITPPHHRKSGVMEAGATAHAQSTQSTGLHTEGMPPTGHAALPSSMIYNMPQALPPAMRGGQSPTPRAGGNPPRPRGIATELPHTVSFSDAIVDESPDTHSSTHPFEQDEYNVSPMLTPQGEFVSYFSFALRMCLYLFYHALSYIPST